MPARPRILYVVNEAYFFVSHRLPLAHVARAAGFEVHLAAPADNVWAPADYDVSTLAAESITFHAIPLERRGHNPLADLYTFLAIVRLFRRLRPEIVHFVTIKPVLYGGLAARLVGVPAVVSAVSGLGQLFVATGPKARGLRWAICRLYRLATGHANGRVIVQNAGDGKMLAASGAVEERRLVLIRGAGVDLEAFTPRPESPGPPLVIFASRLIWEKGVGEFVASARRLRAAGVSARFALVGNTTAAIDRAVPEARLRDWVEEGIVEWWGRREDMADVLAAAHVVCLPSRYGEGVPKILLEAAAAGRPVVASDIAGCRDVVAHGETGLLVPPGDEAALADALKRLIDDAELRRAMGRKGRNLACRAFDVDTVAAQTLELYRELLATAGLPVSPSAALRTRS